MTKYEGAALAGTLLGVLVGAAGCGDSSEGAGTLAGQAGAATAAAGSTSGPGGPSGSGGSGAGTGGEGTAGAGASSGCGVCAPGSCGVQEDGCGQVVWCGVCSACCGTDCTGQWGKVTAIADNAHPSLYYDTAEIEELRQMVLVDHQPPHLYDRWINEIQGAVPVPAKSTWNPNDANMRAALSYALEPTDAKADALRDVLFSFVTAYPNGGGSEGDAWYGSEGWTFSGYSVPWIFDLLMAYHPDKLSADDVAQLKAWFSLTSTIWRAGQFVDETGAVITKESKSIGEYANWWSRYLGPGLAAALVSGNQADVDFWADSGWSQQELTYDGSYEVPQSHNRFDLIMYLLAVFPSGANYDSYTREGYQHDEASWYTVDYTWGAYHWAQMIGISMGAEMVFHNGMKGVFAISDAGTEPALLRTYHRAIESRGEPDAQPTNTTGHPVIGWDPFLHLGYRRFGDAVLESAEPEIVGFPAIGPGGSPVAGFDIPGALLEFLAYPRHVVWSTGDPTSPPVCP